jgi:cytochrome c2
MVGDPADISRYLLEGAVRSRSARVALWVAGLCVALVGCSGGKAKGRENSIATGGDPQQGKQIIRSYGCGACHIIPGIRTARGLVGPPLFDFGDRTMIAGELPNTPPNLVRWIRNPKAIEPKTAMPDLGLSKQQATNAAAYLFTLRR